MGNVAQDRLTTYFQTHHAWTPPWDRIRLVREGWALHAGMLLCRDNNATTIALPGRYEVHYREGIPEAVFAHELAHVWQMELMGVARYVAAYAWEMLRVGYRECRFEREARSVAERYWRERT